MPRYYWTASPTVTAVDIAKNLTHWQARLVLPAPSATAVQALQAQGLVVVSDVENEQPVLHIRGFKQASELFSALEKAGLVTGAPDKKEALPEELNPQARSWRSYIRDHSIQLAGATYLVADMMPIMSGIIRKTPQEVMQGLTWGSTSLLLLLCGRKNPDVQMGTIYRKFDDFLARENVTLPEDAADALGKLKSDPTLANKLLNFFYEHPVLTNNFVQGYGGLNQVMAGRNQQNIFKQIAGASVTVGMWGGLVIPEDPYAGLAPSDKAAMQTRRAAGDETALGVQTRFVDNPVAWLQEKPLRLSGIGPMVGNIMTGLSAIIRDRKRVNEYFGKEHAMAGAITDFTRSSEDLLRSTGLSRSDAKTADMLGVHRASQFTILSPPINMVANTLYGMSSKEDRSVNLDKEGYLDDLFVMAARAYATVPAEDRSLKLIRFAGFLRAQPDIRLSEQAIIERVEQKIAALDTHHWRNKIETSPEPQSGLSMS